ncbi:hypothetical protein T01_14887 [Trichinella spiralis]|uniref:Uncharacterized protein n=1 Tax=Trichinella spiralis TaxID=6334 RepID=A0A0V1ATQ9_TRISP|nr:hypothetical protein T01_14887 [Trichinella spiralis]
MLKMTINKIAIDLRFVENDLFQLEVNKIHLLCSTILRMHYFNDKAALGATNYKTIYPEILIIAFLGACKKSRGVFERVMSVFVKTQSYSRMLTDGSEILLSHTWIKA